MNLHSKSLLTPARRHQNLQPAPEEAGRQELPGDEKVDSFISSSAEPQLGHSGRDAVADFGSFSKGLPQVMQR